VSSQVRYRRIRERELPSFRSAYRASTTQSILQSRFLEDESISLRLPDLEEVWEALSNNPTLADVATLGQGLAYHGEKLPSKSVTYSRERFSGAKPGFVLFESGLKLHELPTQYWMNVNPSVIHRRRSGTTTGVPQVLLNYARASRGPWRLKALIDRKGHPVTSRFIPIRPTQSLYSLEVIWALLNSPIANAYAFAHLSKRDNIVGNIRKIPVPEQGSFQALTHAAVAYLNAALSDANLGTLQRLLLLVDVEVLKLYSLPLHLEHSVLAMFSNWERVGVSFSQNGYLPSELSKYMSLSEFLEFEEDWSKTNRERGLLIDKSISKTLSAAETSRLYSLQAYADYYLEKVSPRPTKFLDELEQKLFNEDVRAR
jgi:hypothetical protein